MDRTKIPRGPRGKQQEATVREYDTPDGYINAMRQLQGQGYDLFLRVHKPRARKSKMVALRFAGNTTIH